MTSLSLAFIYPGKVKLKKKNSEVSEPRQATTETHNVTNIIILSKQI